MQEFIEGKGVKAEVLLAMQTPTHEYQEICFSFFKMRIEYDDRSARSSGDFN